MLSLPGPGVQFLAGELRPHELPGAAKKTKTTLSFSHTPFSSPHYFSPEAAFQSTFPERFHTYKMQIWLHSMFLPFCINGGIPDTQSWMSTELKCMCYITCNILRHHTLQVQTNLKLSEAAEFPFSKLLHTACLGTWINLKLFLLVTVNAAVDVFVPYPSTPVRERILSFCQS